VRLTNDDCWRLLGSADHGVLCTAGARQHIDAVPVCFVVAYQSIVTPIDRVKPKETTELGRLKNLQRNANATLLCDHWNPHDWSRLWWVRAHLVNRSGHDVSPTLLEQCETALRQKYVQYQDTDFAEMIFFDVQSLVGWSAADQTVESDVTDPLI
jgi:PPOX class probable F420-dependent enzyme